MSSSLWYVLIIQTSTLRGLVIWPTRDSAEECRLPGLSLSFMLLPDPSWTLSSLRTVIRLVSHLEHGIFHI